MKYCLLLLFLLGGCIPSQEQSPPYFVMIVDQEQPFLRCGGVLLNEREILTVEHCFRKAGKDTIVTQHGQQSGFTISDKWTDADLILLHSNRDLFSESYAELDNPDPTKPALVFGACPRFFSHVPRSVLFLFEVGEEDFSRQAYYTYGSICGGDSGSPLLQNGKVVGLVDSTVTMSFTLTTVQVMYTIPPKLIEDSLWQTASNN